MKIIIGADHRGFALKTQLKADITEYALGEQQNALEWIDVGTDRAERTDYPCIAKKACQLMLQHVADHAILICGSGVGMAIAANRFPKIYAALCWDEAVARIAHADDGANVLVLSADLIDANQNIGIARAMIQSWADRSFKGGRYQERLDMVDHTT